MTIFLYIRKRASPFIQALVILNICKPPTFKRLLNVCFKYCVHTIDFNNVSQAIELTNHNEIKEIDFIN